MRKLLVKEIAYQDPLTAFWQFSKEAGTIFLHSATPNATSGRYSFVMSSPFQILHSKKGIIHNGNHKRAGDPLSILKQAIAQFTIAKENDLPPLQTGVAGFFSYDLVQHLEHIPQAREASPFPDLCLGFYDVTIAWDHQTKRAWIISAGFPYLEEQQRLRHAAKRLDEFTARLTAPSPLPQDTETTPALSIESNFSKANYCHAVQKVIDAIHEGQVFQVNLSQRFSAALPRDFNAATLYLRLNAQNPAPFSAYVNLLGTTLVSASPERFLKLTEGQVETRPIKGTRARHHEPLLDLALKFALQQSPKDLAENTMIVDLLRNDLSRICLDHSVKVTQLCAVESFATVHHLVSVIEGQLRPDCDAIDLLRATFPGGSITGAPKIRAMEIIADLEPNQRGPYCGSLGYLSFTGAMDLSILIRTYAIHQQQLSFQAGGGIVADSDPQAEYEETLVKTQALQSALMTCMLKK
jgi:para-aminobenzoate synthetase component 1